MINLSPREYQKIIFNTAKEKNSLVVLPTGLGKTLIALMLSVERLNKYPGQKIIFLAPTKPLVEQHFQTFKENLPELFAELTLFTGAIPSEKRKKLFQTAEVIFSTPQCVANDIRKGLYSLSDSSLLIIDEAHRCLKNYDYTKVAQFYKAHAKNPLILGLTASPGVDSSRIKEICKNLSIEAIESRTRDSEDVKPYLQERKFKKIEVPFPNEFKEIKILLSRIWDSLILKLREKNLLFGPANKITLLKLQSNLSRRIAQKDFFAISGISLTAQAIKISHAIELLETQTLSGLHEYLQNLIRQAEKKQSRAVQTLVNNPEFKAALLSTTRLLNENKEHPKLGEIISIMEEQFKKENNPKVIIFTQFRETAHRITEKIKHISGINPAVFIGQAKKSSRSGFSGLSQKEQKALIEKFRDGEINVICATSIGEEGLDIPEVSMVIFYEPIPSAIRKIQRAGRTARLNPGEILILVTKDTRDIAYHYASSAREKRMHKSLDLVKEDLQKKTKTLSDFK